MSITKLIGHYNITLKWLTKDETEMSIGIFQVSRDETEVQNLMYKIDWQNDKNERETYIITSQRTCKIMNIVLLNFYWIVTALWDEVTTEWGPARSNSFPKQFLTRCRWFHKIYCRIHQCQYRSFSTILILAEEYPPNMNSRISFFSWHINGDQQPQRQQFIYSNTPKGDKIVETVAI